MSHYLIQSECKKCHKEFEYHYIGGRVRTVCPECGGSKRPIA